ncbi:ABC transporter ATP-binding protein [Solicola gregarius]|uniref:ATP-binding cassette domain-containing protein n=1 Tax=Solicola gregarius TaxID=2908642 RepID=A0AA46TLZ5_9ACTN|nr:oligopeptide/dipeptide ABC transporter ATP-binding protein [Solicola gregarius]UYM07741.1 ATP-binding cassette domain-containing protein [Solicola gregarius]
MTATHDVPVDTRTPPRSSPLLRVRGLSVSYAPPKKATSLGTGAALSDADLEVEAGTIIGIVGETGSGKTTLARATVGLVPPAAGQIEFAGTDIGRLRGRALRRFRRSGQVQLVFQDPLRSLDPDLTVADLVREPLDIAGALPRGERVERVAESLRMVGLEPDGVLGRRPRELSGGQRQRVSLARAISTRPRLLICDEPVSALDVSNRNLVLNLLDRLRSELDLAIVVIAHDLSSLAGIADRVAVFYRGRIVEHGPIRTTLERPAHPYTALLAASAPSLAQADQLRPDQLLPESGTRPWAADSGCVFAPRCRFAHDACVDQPELTPVPRTPERQAACHVAVSWRDRVGAYDVASESA